MPRWEQAGSSDDPQERASLARMRIVDTQTMTPLLLWLFANTAGPDRRAALLALESYVVRRTLCRLTTKNYNRLLLDLLRRLGAGDGAAGELVPAYLASQSSESGMWPTDEELRRSLGMLELYRLLSVYRDTAYGPSLPRIAVAYTSFRGALDELNGDSAEDAAATIFDALGEVLLEHLEVVVIDLGEDDNAQVIFETLSKPFASLTSTDPEARRRLHEYQERRSAGGLDPTQPGSKPSGGACGGW